MKLEEIERMGLSQNRSFPAPVPLQLWQSHSQYLLYPAHHLPPLQLPSCTSSLLAKDHFRLDRLIHLGGGAGLTSRTAFRGPQPWGDTSCCLDNPFIWGLGVRILVMGDQSQPSVGRPASWTADGRAQWGQACLPGLLWSHPCFCLEIHLGKPLWKEEVS